MNLFRATIAPVAGGGAFFRAIMVTGSHEASVAAVAEGLADLAAIDCVSFALLERGRPELIERVAVVAESPRSPSLPSRKRLASGLRPSPRCARPCSPRSMIRVSPGRATPARACGRAGPHATRRPARARARERAAIATGYPTLV